MLGSCYTGTTTCQKDHRRYVALCEGCLWSCLWKTHSRQSYKFDAYTNNGMHTPDIPLFLMNAGQITTNGKGCSL